MSIKACNQTDLIDKPIPKSITNWIPLPLELTAIAVAVVASAVNPLGWFTALGLGATSVTMSKQCLYDAQVAPLSMHKQEEQNLRLLQRQTQYFSSQKKAAEYQIKTAIAQRKGSEEQHKAAEEQIKAASEQYKAAEEQIKVASLIKPAVIAGLCGFIFSIFSSYLASNCMKEELPQSDQFFRNVCILSKGVVSIAVLSGLTSAAVLTKRLFN